MGVLYAICRFPDRGFPEFGTELYGAYCSIPGTGGSGHGAHSERSAFLAAMMVPMAVFTVGRGMISSRQVGDLFDLFCDQTFLVDAFTHVAGRHRPPGWMGLLSLKSAPRSG